MMLVRIVVAMSLYALGSQIAQVMGIGDDHLGGVTLFGAGAVSHAVLTRLS
jgi:hypothetical protein